MSSAEKFDAIVIGSGQGGTPLSTALANAGMRTALLERSHVGGTCINEGCTPTKTMVASGRVAYLARRSADYGIASGNVAVDMAKVRQRKRDIVDSFRGGSQKRLEGTANLSLIFGQASFTGSRTVRVEGRTLTAEKIFINAGARPAVPELSGLQDVPFLSSTSIMELDVLPGHLLVLGGGYVGLEFGQMFRRFGSRVTIVHNGKQLLGREDRDVADAVAAILREDGIEVLLDARTASVGRQNGEIRLTLEGGGVVSGSHLLIAAGRTPNSDSLNLAAAGVAADGRGFIPVNQRLETNVAGIYALGDINGGPAFTHISYDDYRILKTNVIEHGSASTEGRLVPYTVYIDPQLGRVGITEDEARRQQRKVRVARMPMSYVARALETGESRGFMKAIVDGDSDRILGAAVLGIEGGEVMSMIQLAMMGGLPYTALRDGVFAHPTLAESLNNLFTHWQQ
jgi:pyruvate/2-oxoglutarate dehydrogenase complex dihydrolipoamide dehydrogenase (E3) component